MTDAKPILLADKPLRAKNGVFVMGILNVTPDSFYGKSRVQDEETAAQKALYMVENGADIIDIGAESTRPGATYISESEQCARILPVIKAIRRVTDCPISIDTRKKAVFERAFDTGADMLNDVSALEDDAELGPFCAANNLPVILMHKRAIPAVMMQKVCYTDVVREVDSYLCARTRAARDMGIRQIIVDPGIGFAKQTRENCCLIRRAADFSQNGTVPVLIGASRKTVIGALTGQSTENRLTGTVTAHLLAVLHGASILRVHDVRETVDMLKVLRGIESDII